QTEDKGSTNPFIESLVYVGGQVLATKRASYATLLSAGQDEKAVVSMMDHQHRTMIAAIKHGKFDEKLQALNASRKTGAHAMITPAQLAAVGIPAEPAVPTPPPLPP